MMRLIQAIQANFFHLDLGQSAVPNPIQVQIDGSRQIDNQLGRRAGHQPNRVWHIGGSDRVTGRGSQTMDLTNRGYLPSMNDSPLPKNRELIAKLLDFAQNMGAKRERATLGPGLAYQRQYLVSHRRIQIRGRFIQNH